MLSAVHERTKGRISGPVAALLYLLAISTFVALLPVLQAWRDEPWMPEYAPVYVYLVLGLLLNRIVLRRLVEWHPMTNNLRVVTDAKLVSLVLWPFVYGHLLLRVLVNWLL